MDADAIIEGYQNLRTQAYEYMRANPKCLGGDEWLRYAISEWDIQLTTAGDQIEAYGTCYTAQTMSHENFSFYIPKSVLKE